MTPTDSSHSPIALPLYAGSLCRPTVTIPPTANNETVNAVFQDNADLIGLVVVEDGRPIGLINRNIFFSQMAQPFRRELYLRKSCLAFMDKEPLVVDQFIALEELSYRAVALGEKALADGVIICSQGRYLGTASGVDLLRALADLQAARNRQVMASIDYASVIQNSFLKNSRQALESCLQQAFLLWQPRDPVGGDCYYCRSTAEGLFLALIDCTGHGVPGAFMTLIVSSALSQAAERQSLSDPAAVMGEVNRLVKSGLGQELRPGERASASRSDDGMDGGFLWIPRGASSVTYAGARIPLYLEREDDGDAVCVEACRRGVGYVDTPMDQTWTNRVVPVTPGTTAFLTSDGMIDQIGGPKRIAFGRRRILECLRATRGSPVRERGEALWSHLLAYQGSETRRDDASFFLGHTATR